MILCSALCKLPIIFLMDDQIFLPIGEVWLMHIAGMHCTIAERKEAKGQRKLFMLNFFLSCHKILILLLNSI